MQFAYNNCSHVNTLYYLWGVSKKSICLSTRTSFKKERLATHLGLQEREGRESTNLTPQETNLLQYNLSIHILLYKWIQSWYQQACTQANQIAQ